MEHSQVIKFTESHEWIRIECNQIIVGLSSYAQKELGEIVYIELPELEKKYKIGKEIAVIESTKAASDIYSPVTGTVIRVNETLKKNPSLINQDPEGEGWLFVMTLEKVAELDTLLNHPQYV